MSTLSLLPAHAAQSARKTAPIHRLRLLIVSIPDNAQRARHLRGAVSFRDERPEAAAPLPVRAGCGPAHGLPPGRPCTPAPSAAPPLPPAPPPAHRPSPAPCPSPWPCMPAARATSSPDPRGSRRKDYRGDAESAEDLGGKVSAPSASPR